MCLCSWATGPNLNSFLFSLRFLSLGLEDPSVQTFRVWHFQPRQEKLRDQPDFSKTRLCADFVELGRCSEGRNCKFAHGRHELKPGSAAKVARRRPEVTEVRATRATRQTAWEVPKEAAREVVRVHHVHEQAALKLMMQAVKPKAKDRQLNRLGLAWVAHLYDCAWQFKFLRVWCCLMFVPPWGCYRTWWPWKEDEDNCFDLNGDSAFSGWVVVTMPCRAGNCRSSVMSSSLPPSPRHWELQSPDHLGGTGDVKRLQSRLLHGEWDSGAGRAAQGARASAGARLGWAEGFKAKLEGNRALVLGKTGNDRKWMLSMWAGKTVAYGTLHKLP